MHPWSRWYHLYDLFSLSVTSRFARQALRNQQSTSTKTWLSCWMRPGWNLDVKISDQQMFLFGVFSCFLCWILPYDKYTLKRCVINVFWLFSIDVHLQMMDILNCRYRYIYIMNLPEYLCKKIDTWKTHSSEPIPRTRRGFAQRKGARLKWRPWTRWFVPNARARQDGGWPWSKWSRMMNGVGEMDGCEAWWKIAVMQKREREREADIFNIFLNTKISKDVCQQTIKLCERFSIQTMRPNSAFLGFQGQTSITMSQVYISYVIGLPYASCALWF